MPRRLLYLLLPLLLIAALWSAFWWWSAAELGRQVDDWQETQATHGHRVSFSERRISGFPFYLRLRLSEPEMEDSSGWRWSGPTITGKAAVWRPQHISFSFPGTQHLLPPEGSPLAPLELAAGDARGEAALDQSGRLEGLELHFRRLALAGYVDGGTSAEVLELAWGSKSVAANTEAEEDADREGLPFRFRLEDLSLPGALDPPLGKSLEHLSASGRLQGRPRLGPPADAFPRWAEEGGVLDLQRLEMTWGPLNLAGEASLSLDERARPLGAGTARVTGFETTIQHFADAGFIDGDIAETVSGALTALSSRTEEGQHFIEVPLSAQDGVLMVGPLPLLPLPPLF